MQTQLKRSQILQAALDLLTEHGFHGAPISAIAHQANVGAGTIYRYFSNKDLLITELFQEIHSRICARMLEGYAPERSIEERYFHLSNTLLRFFIENPKEFRYIEQYHHSPYGIAYRRERILGNGGERIPYRVLFEEGVACREIRDLPLVVLFALTFGPLVTVARDHILAFVVLDPALQVQVVTACWNSIKAP